MEYYSPTDLNEAYSLLDKYGEDAIPIAGSTFYMGHREELFDEVEAVINIKQLGLSYIRQDGDGLRIGATTTLNEIFAHELTSKGTFGILAETVKELNINEVRNMATIGGEVCIAGEVDMPTTLLAYDANIVIGGSKGVREISMADFHIGYLNNALEPGEMVLEVHIPQPPPIRAPGLPNSKGPRQTCPSSTWQPGYRWITPGRVQKQEWWPAQPPCPACRNAPPRQKLRCSIK